MSSDVFGSWPDLDSRLASPRPRPRLWGSKTKTKTLMSKTKTETQDLQDQYWKSMTVTNKKTEKVMASRKSSIPVVAHSKQQNIIPCLTTVLFPQLPSIIAVYKTFVRTRNISQVWCSINMSKLMSKCFWSYNYRLISHKLCSNMKTYNLLLHRK